MSHRDRVDEATCLEWLSTDPDAFAGDEWDLAAQDADIAAREEFVALILNHPELLPYDPYAEPRDGAEDPCHVAEPAEPPLREATGGVPGLRDCDDLSAVRAVEDDLWLASLLADDDAAPPLSPLQAVKRGAAVRGEGDLMLLMAAWSVVEEALRADLAWAYTPKTRIQTEEQARFDALADQSPPTTVPCGGLGTPEVSLGLAEEFACAAGMSSRAATHWVTAAAELHFRLPQTWARVQARKIPALKAIHLTKHTLDLSQRAVAFVDDAARGNLAAMSFKRIEQLAAVARATFDHTSTAGKPDPERNRAEILHGAGTGQSQMIITADSDDLARFDRSLSEVARQLHALGDTSDLDARRSKAVGILASPQQCLDLFALDVDTVAAAGEALGYEPGTLDPRLLTQPGSLPVMELVVHVHGSALGDDVIRDESAGAALTRVARLGPQAIDTIRRWIGHHKVVVRPVLDVQAVPGVDRYEIPASLRRAVESRNPTCVFPHCGRESSLDLDHIDPFDRPRAGGGGGSGSSGGSSPPQTRLDNLAPLCRRHHRLKTHCGWTYQRPTCGEDGDSDPSTFVWTSPAGYHYLVDPSGTHDITTSHAHALTA